MSLSHDHNNLFRRSDISDQLSLMQSLLDSKDLTPAEAIALLHIIRLELESPQPQRSSVYRRYTQVMQSLRREMPEVHEQVVQAWEAKKAQAPTNKQPAEDFAEWGEESNKGRASASIGGASQAPEKAAYSIEENGDAPHANDEAAEGLEVAEADHEEPEESKEEEQPEVEKEEREEQFEEVEEHSSPEAEAKVEINEEDEEVEQEESKAELLEETQEQIEEPGENETIEVAEAQSEPDGEIKRGPEEPSETREKNGEAGEGEEGGDRLASEAAEASQHMEVEPDVMEVPGDQEPPIEAEE